MEGKLTSGSQFCCAYLSIFSGNPLNLEIFTFGKNIECVKDPILEDSFFAKIIEMRGGRLQILGIVRSAMFGIF